VPSDVPSDVGEGGEEVPEVELEPQAQDTLAQVGLHTHRYRDIEMDIDIDIDMGTHNTHNTSHHRDSCT
jgi:hypothetical protein